MCLLVFAYRSHPHYPLVVAANRDEFYNRTSAPLHFWEDAPQILAGRDLEQGGTWMGVSRQGRFAAVTNYRDPRTVRQDAPSRGALVADFLRGGWEARDYLEYLENESQPYNGFSLVFGFVDKLYWYSNVGGRPARLWPGIHGLSNHLLNTVWPKIQRSKEIMAGVLARESGDMSEPLLEMLRDDTPAPDASLPDTGVGLKLERALSPLFVNIPEHHYGTRSSTVLLVDRFGEVLMREQNWNERGELMRESRQHFVLKDREPVGS